MEVGIGGCVYGRNRLQVCLSGPSHLLQSLHLWSPRSMVWEDYSLWHEDTVSSFLELQNFHLRPFGLILKKRDGLLAKVPDLQE